MIYFKPQYSIKRKILFSMIICSIFGYGIYFYFTNRHAFSNYKSYYFKSYTYVIGYRIGQVLSLGKAMYASGLSLPDDPYAKSVPVLLYHGVVGGTSEDTQGEATNIDLATFWDQMKTLKDSGWQTITMQDFYDFKRGIKKLPAKSFLLTFDDGRKDSYYPADPILKALGFHAVMFVIDKYSLEENSKYYLSKDELLQMSKSSNWEIESHGYSSHSNYPIDATGDKGHFFSNKLWLPDQKRLETTNEYVVRTTQDLEQAKDSLEQTFKTPMIAFAYPFGDYGISTVNFPQSQNIITKIVGQIYPLSFYQYSSVYRYSQNYPEPDNTSGIFTARRIGMSQTSGKDLLAIFNRGLDKKIPFTAQFNNSDGWVNTDWGFMDLSKGTLDIGSIKDSTGSTVVLDGSNSWRDYEVTAQVNWIKGSNIYLAARYKDDNNLTACNFKKNLVHVEQTYNGTTRVIAGKDNIFDPGESDFTISIKVFGRTVECSINGVPVVKSDFLEEPLSSGGIAVKSWDPNYGSSEMIVKQLSVEPL